MALGIMEDITELMVMQESYEHLFSLSMDGILITEPDSGKVLAANPSALILLGLRQSDLPIQREQIVDMTDQRVGAALVERNTQGAFRGEMRFKHACGNHFDVRSGSANLNS
jgi:PAS domain-containing protein